MGHVRLSGSVVIVTGAAGGIGAATVRTLIDRGATVVAADHDAERLAAPPQGVDTLVADVRDPHHADRLIDHAVARHGRLDAVVANAGVGHAGEFAVMPAQRIDELIQVNLQAPLLLARAALPALLDRGGAVVFTTSIAGTLLVPNEAVYSATKAGVEAFAETLREELRGRGVTVSTVLPAVVDTRFFETRGEPYARTRPRPVPPERVARAIVHALEHGTARLVVPPSFRVPIRIHALAPGIYRRLARRFG